MVYIIRSRQQDAGRRYFAPPFPCTRAERVNNNSEFPRKVIMPRYKVAAASDTDKVDKLRAEFDKLRAEFDTLVEVLEAAGIMDKGFETINKTEKSESVSIAPPSFITVSCKDPDLWNEVKDSIVDYVNRVDGPVRVYIAEYNEASTADQDESEN